MNPVLAARLARRDGTLRTSFAEADGKLFIAQTQDCTPIAERAKALHNAGEFGSSEMRHAATIPDVILEKYMNEHRVSYAELMSNPEHFRRICNDPDNKMFRIWPGRL
ncbi:MULTISPECIES: hypothetical protein [unclassified Massilia]|uniref:hypothetical protein n=1 Tax=unclassified Massilia TaxID=2609279 RepID=UPI00068D8EE0|nr:MULTISPECIES: hypothetical protein [unclassified Massilia]ALK99541.2 hypothetical protein AM586_12635 [Massilia sp. WG5]